MTTQEPSTEPIVYVVDDDPSVRKSMARMFKSQGLRIETFASAQEFLDYPRTDVPGCLILDVDMPGQTGLELQEQLAAAEFDLPILFLTGKGDIPMTVQAMKAGAVDFLPKPVDHEQLVKTVQRAVESHTQARQESASIRQFRQRVESLTKRENQVMMQVINGVLNKQIARKLGITEHTVKVHRGRVMEKTGVDSVAELVLLCERSGIVAVEE